MISITNADQALKDYYLDAVIGELNEKTSPFFTAIDKTSAYVFGKQVKISVAKEGLDSVVACSEEGDLPSPYANRYYEIVVPLKNLYGTIEISDKAMRASGDSSGAFVNLVNAEMQGLVTSAKANFSRMLFGGSDGVIAKIVSSSGKTCRVDQCKYLHVGKRITFLSGEEGSYSVISTATITAINGEMLMVDNAPTSTPTAISGNMQMGNELMGLKDIFYGSTLYGYNRSTTPYFNPRKESVTELSLNDIESLIDTLADREGSEVNMILCSYRTKRMIGRMAADQVRFVSGEEMKLGREVVTVCGVPVVADRSCDENCIYLLNTNDFKLVQLCDWEWLEDEGGKILKQVPGKAAYSATLVKYAELVCTKPCGQGLITFEA